MSTDKLHDEFLKTLPSRMSLFELRRHANNGHSPYHEEAKRRVAEYEQSNEYLNENRLYEMPEEELLNGERFVEIAGAKLVSLSAPITI